MFVPQRKCHKTSTECAAVCDSISDLCFTSVSAVLSGSRHRDRIVEAKNWSQMWFLRNSVIEAATFMFPKHSQITWGVNGQGHEQDMLSAPSVTTSEKPLSKLLNPGLSRWSGSGPVVVLSGCREQLPCMSVSQLLKMTFFWFAQAFTGWIWVIKNPEESSLATYNFLKECVPLPI